MNVVLILGSASEKKTELINTFSEKGFQIYPNWQERLVQCLEKNLDAVRDVQTYFELYSRYPGMSSNLAIVFDEGEVTKEHSELFETEEKVISALKTYADKIYRVEKE